ncbi:hypothetical protein [Phenylobacterium immobile]|uniref:hypothetical protein n=1 Tax=Phenylobacterium immobile TaxID=21 RepID=UPI000AD378CD|nr:hypothetical protein [Phenylobacterium immobile]
MALIEGADLRVTISDVGARDILVVTFTGRDHKPPAAAGAGQGFFEKNGLSAVHFISKANHWWQTPEFAPALKLARLYAQQQGFKEIVTYGSSMGGYAALLATGALKADRAVVSVPQFSVDPAKVPWEDRWIKDQRRITYLNDDMPAMIGETEVIVFSDPLYEPDQNHVDLIAACRPLKQIRVAFAEHDVSRILAETDLLSSATLAAIRGTIDQRDFVRTMRAARKASPLLYGGASRLADRRGKLAAGRILGERAMRMMAGLPATQIRAEHERLVQNWVGILVEAGDHAGALAALKTWASLGQREDFILRRFRARSLEALGHGDRALAEAVLSLRERPSERPTLTMVANWLRAYGDAETGQAIFAEFKTSYLQSDSMAQRLVKALLARGLAAEAKEMQALATERFGAKAAA